MPARAPPGTTTSPRRPSASPNRGGKASSKGRPPSPAARRTVNPASPVAEREEYPRLEPLDFNGWIEKPSLPSAPTRLTPSPARGRSPKGKAVAVVKRVPGPKPESGAPPRHGVEGAQEDEKGTTGQAPQGSWRKKKGKGKGKKGKGRFGKGGGKGGKGKWAGKDGTAGPAVRQVLRK